MIKDRKLGGLNFIAQKSPLKIQGRAKVIIGKNRNFERDTNRVC